MDGFSHAGAAFQLDRGGAGLLQNAHGIAEGHGGAFLVSAKRQVDHDQRALEPRITALAWVIIMSSVTPSGVLQPMHHLPRLSPTSMRST